MMTSLKALMEWPMHWTTLTHVRDKEISINLFLQKKCLLNRTSDLGSFCFEIVKAIDYSNIIINQLFQINIQKRK